MIHTSRRTKPLRVALIAGQMAQAGAEKQLMYMARVLRDAGVNVRVYCLTQGDYYETVLRREGIETFWFGQDTAPPRRVLRLTRMLIHFRPHIVQSATFFTNIYAALAGRIHGAITIGALRSDLQSEMRVLGSMGSPSLRMAHVLIANSQLAQQRAIALGILEANTYLLPNAIDLDEFDRLAAEPVERYVPADKILVAGVGRLAPEKRWERFIHALALARQSMPGLVGVLAGTGPELERLQAVARERELDDDALRFLGHVTNIPALLAQAHMLAHCSDHEGTPNVLMEAMAARLPVITTPAGDASTLVTHEHTGYVVQFDNLSMLTEHIVQLSTQKELATHLGTAGRQRIAQKHGTTHLAQRLLTVYHAAAVQRSAARVLKLLAPYDHTYYG